jgi:hypothetical protein
MPKKKTTKDLADAGVKATKKESAAAEKEQVQRVELVGEEAQHPQKWEGKDYDPDKHYYRCAGVTKRGFDKNQNDCVRKGMKPVPEDKDVRMRGLPCDGELSAPYEMPMKLRDKHIESREKADDRMYEKIALGQAARSRPGGANVVAADGHRINRTHNTRMRRARSKRSISTPGQPIRK